ncbi:site-specific integrase [Sporichthya sp.]|uniref:site-specific integrase n=1 Tax=Sporichthya sp. TaxID=65475 RepID=UPI0017D6F2FA|nr:site-specific integrase [Sporichthya sp.]MBA3741498.1 site-specific integrase [Sporichthya sp.]
MSSRTVSGRAGQLVGARALSSTPYDRAAVLGHLENEIALYRFRERCDRARMLRAAGFTVGELDRLPGQDLRQRWQRFEAETWTGWTGGNTPAVLGERWTWGAWALITSRLVRPSWPLLSQTRTSQWVARLPAEDPLITAHDRLRQAATGLQLGSTPIRATAINRGLRLLLLTGCDELEQLTDEDLHAVTGGKGADTLEVMLHQMGVLDRTPQRGSARMATTPRHSPAQLAVVHGVPAPFTDLVGLYLEHYARRLSDTYPTLRHKAGALGHFFSWLLATHPQVTSCSQLTPAQARGFVTHALELSRQVRRGRHAGEGDSTTAHAWLIDVRTFFADIGAWGSEDGSPFAAHRPAVVPLTRHDLATAGFAKARRRSQARTTRLVLDLERELPNIRAFGLRRWHETQQMLAGETAATDDPATDSDADNSAGADAQKVRAERIAFWDWALLELLLTSGLRIEEACELTTLDVLRRQLPDGRLYYLLHIKPSKFGRARVIPIGDQLGRVIAEIVRHVRAFHGTDQVPACDRRDFHEKRPLPRAPYLLQSRTHPAALGTSTIRARLRALSLAAGARHADGSALELAPHDCRRAFASEHLNANTPVHVIAALLGHAGVNTVMIYAKLYPTQLVEDYRKAMRGLYGDVYGPEAAAHPSDADWAAFTASCSMRDMGTHLCALPTGEHCPRGLVCLGCGHAQPKKSAAPTFRRMLASHSRALDRARTGGEPAGQIASRELEVERIRSALGRAEELSADAAAALEAAAI